MRRFARRALGVMIAGCSSCEEPDPEDSFEHLPIRYVTDELEIATSFEETLCEGDLRWLDTHTRHVEETLGVVVDRLWELHVYDYAPIPGCPAANTGCFRRDHDVALGMYPSLPHEIVHAVSVEIGPPPRRFWNEGLAEALSDHALAYVSSDLVAESTSTAKYINYAIPAHFIRWLIGWRGIETYLEVFRGDEFSAVYGMDLADVEQIYDAETPEVLEPLVPCDDEPILADEDGSFNLTVDLDCDAPTTTRIRHGFEPGYVGDIHVIEVTEPSTYSVVVDGGFSAFIGGCQSAAGDRLDKIGDVQNETAELPDDDFTYLQIGEENELFLPAWKYRVVVVAEDRGTPGDVTWTFTPRP